MVDFDEIKRRKRAPAKRLSGFVQDSQSDDESQKTEASFIAEVHDSGSEDSQAFIQAIRSTKASREPTASSSRSTRSSTEQPEQPASPLSGGFDAITKSSMASASQLSERNEIDRLFVAARGYGQSNATHDALVDNNKELSEEHSGPGGDDTLQITGVKRNTKERLLPSLNAFFQDTPNETQLVVYTANDKRVKRVTFDQTTAFPRSNDIDTPALATRNMRQLAHKTKKRAAHMMLGEKLYLKKRKYSPAGDTETSVDEAAEVDKGSSDLTDVDDEPETEISKCIRQATQLLERRMQTWEMRCKLLETKVADLEGQIAGFLSQSNTLGAPPIENPSLKALDTNRRINSLQFVLKVFVDTEPLPTTFLLPGQSVTKLNKLKKNVITLLNDTISIDEQSITAIDLERVTDGEHDNTNEETEDKPTSFVPVLEPRAYREWWKSILDDPEGKEQWNIQLYIETDAGK